MGRAEASLEQHDTMKVVIKISSESERQERGSAREKTVKLLLAKPG